MLMNFAPSNGQSAALGALEGTQARQRTGTKKKLPRASFPSHKVVQR